MAAHGNTSVEAIAQRIFDALARAFPVSCASDEFFFFPQVILAEPKWDTWDCFSEDTIKDFTRRISAWEDELNLLMASSSFQSDLGGRIDVVLLKGLLMNLREQLSEVRAWEYQPTLYLTISCIGIAEVMECEDQAARHERARGLPAFLDQACRNLNNVPVLFRDIGLQMIPDTRNYLVFLEQKIPELKPALSALDRFKEALRCVSTREYFILPGDILERILSSHIHYYMDIKEINHMLDQEIDEMQQVLNKEARGFLPDRFTGQSPERLWFRVLKCIHHPVPGKDGIIGLYKREVKRLAEHCIEYGLVLPETVSSCPVRVDNMPSYLSAIRSSSSYSIPPRHPPSGGTFYIIDNNESVKDKRDRHIEYKMLAAHETYPGHHLLDASRWSLPHLCRRVLERPVFYEGWACFAEEILKLTGYFSTPIDRFLIAKRRLWRAIRGKVDIGLQTGAMSIKEAAIKLKGTGITMEQAVSSAVKYTLNPGYQSCYTLGLHSFLELFDRYGSNNLERFVRIALSEGEIDFASLKEIFRNRDRNR